MQSELHTALKDFEDRSLKLSAEGFSIELRLLIEKAQKAERERIEQLLFTLKNRWEADRDNDTLKYGSIVSEIILKALKTEPPGRKELLELVSAYDKTYFRHDDYDD